MEGDISIAGADDGDSLETGEGDGEDDSQVGSDPEPAFVCHEGGYMNALGATEGISNGSVDGGSDTHVLQVLERLEMVEADSATLGSCDPETNS
jgi:hypothetical protein